MISVPGVDSKAVLPMKENNSVLCDFDAIVDTDIGILKYLLRYKNSKYFNYRFKSIEDESQINDIVLFRENINPIIEIIDTSQTSEEEANNLIKEICTDKEAYKEVLSLSKDTDILTLMKAYLGQSTGLKVCILCHNEEEVKIVKEKCPRANTLISERKDINSDYYNAYFIKYYIELMQLDRKILDFSGNQIYVLKYKFNMDDYENDIPIRAINFLLYERNEIKVIYPYNNPKLPKG